VSYSNVGSVLQAQGHLSDALEAYRDALTIRERLAKTDPGNTSWQSDLASAYNLVGNVLRAQGNLPEALKPTATASQSESAWPRPIPAMPAGSSFFQSPTTKSASCYPPKAI
jgi:tetratricopeptide (TPR) repeat protein